MAKKVSEPYNEYIKTKKGTLQIHSVEEKVKISTLRGKLKKQSESEITDQIDEIRKEWERDI